MYIMELVLYMIYVCMYETEKDYTKLILYNRDNYDNTLYRYISIKISYTKQFF